MSRLRRCDVRNCVPPLLRRARHLARMGWWVSDGRWLMTGSSKVLAAGLARLGGGDLAFAWLQLGVLGSAGDRGQVWTAEHGAKVIVQDAMMPFILFYLVAMKGVRHRKEVMKRECTLRD